MKKKLPYITTIVGMLLFIVSCSKDEDKQNIPSYLHIEAINLVDDASNSWSQESGFFTHDIDAVQIVLYVEGDKAETVVGTFQLPCTVPILRTGNINTMTITPVVKQNGIAATRIAYPFYNTITLNDITLTADSTTDLGTLQTTYISRNTMRVVWSEFFEPGPSEISLDSVIKRLVYQVDTIRSGNGCGVIRLNDTIKSVNFWTDTTYHVDIESYRYLYLEMDYWTDFNFSIGFKNPRITGGTDETQSAETLYANSRKGWQKIYINLGRLWTYYNHYPDLRLYFTLLNDPPHGGNFYVDNMKLIAM